MSGHLYWSPPTWLKPIIVAKTLVDKGFTPDWDQFGGGISVEHADGRHVHVYSPGHENQPQHGGLVGLRLSFAALRVIDDARLFKGLGPRASLAPLEVWLQDEVVDVWEIPSTARTQWTLTHSFGYATAASVSPPIPYVAPRVTIEERAGGAPLVTMTVVNPPSTPTGTEVLVDNTADGETLTTADLSGSYAGKLLFCYYQPLLRCTLPPWSQTRQTVNDLRAEVAFEVKPQTKNWSNG